LKAIQDSNGLSATTFLGFQAVRANQVKADLEIVGRLESVLLSVLDPDLDATNHSIRLFKHSGYGKGMEVNLATQSSFARDEANTNDKDSIFYQHKHTEKEESRQGEWRSKQKGSDGR
jgi:hypothetical protein